MISLKPVDSGGEIQRLRERLQRATQRADMLAREAGRLRWRLEDARATAWVAAVCSGALMFAAGVAIERWWGCV